VDLNPKDWPDPNPKKIFDPNPNWKKLILIHITCFNILLVTFYGITVLSWKYFVFVFIKLLTPVLDIGTITDPYLK
jgi:hypothetical protein